MIITRTPFRVPLGGGGTDLPSFYKNHGGFIFSATIDMYMYVTLNCPQIDRLIRLKYSESETVESVKELKHELAREALNFCKIHDQVEITSFADVPSGTGMGSSSSYLVGLLKALHTVKRETITMQELAKEACKIELDILKKPIGKQDQYLASLGGFVVMDIDQVGKVNVRKAKLSQDTIDELEYKCMLFYTHKKHDTVNILKDQSKEAAVSKSQVEKSLMQIKEIGKEILSDFEKGKVDNFGKLMDKHWNIKKTMSVKISGPFLDKAYETALQNGAEGGKLMGSGGGGLFLFFAPKEKQKLKTALESLGLNELKYKFDFEGSKVLLDLFEHGHESR